MYFVIRNITRIDCIIGKNVRIKKHTVRIRNTNVDKNQLYSRLLNDHGDRIIHFEDDTAVDRFFEFLNDIQNLLNI